jgi:RNA polymerase sigma-32 factor
MSRQDPDRTAVSVYMNDVQRHDLLTREEEQELARRWVQDRDERAADELVRRNLRFVVKVAMGYRKYGLPVTDLIQEGNLGLIRAVEKFDPDKGTRLISYAVWWIKAYIQSYIIQSWSLVRVGTTQTQRRLFYKLPRALAQGREPGEGQESWIARVSEELDARPKDVKLMLNALRGRDLSLDVPLDDGGGVTWGDRVEEPGADPEEATAESEDAAFRARILRDCLERLPERERDIMTLRHLGPDALTLRDVGKRLGMSRERVRQLEAQALRKLQSMMKSRYEARRVA